MVIFLYIIDGEQTLLFDQAPRSPTSFTPRDKRGGGCCVEREPTHISPPLSAKGNISQAAEP